MERQAIRRLEEKTLTPEEIENVGIALMKLEKTVHELAKRFKLDPKDLNLDLGPIGTIALIPVRSSDPDTTLVPEQDAARAAFAEGACAVAV